MFHRQGHVARRAFVVAVVAALAIGAAACGGGSSTNTSSSSTSASSGGSSSSGSGSGGGGQTTGKPTISSFSAPSTVACKAATTITLSWTTQNATSATISIDGPGIYASYKPSGSASVPFACDGKSHTYLLTAKGSNGTATSTRVVSQATNPSTTSTTKK